jgi:hypothetical protein
VAGWDRAILHGEALVKQALERTRAGLNPGDTTLLVDGCVAASMLLAVGRREPARSLIRLLSRTFAIEALPPEVSPSLQTLVREFAAWTGDAGFLEKHAGRLAGDWREAVGEEGGAGREARGEGSTATVALIASIVRGVWGLAPLATDERLGISLSPSTGADEMALTGVRVGRTTLSVRYRRRPGQVVLRCEVTRGPALRVCAALGGAAAVDVTVDEVALGGGRAVFVASGGHEVVFGLVE